MVILCTLLFDRTVVARIASFIVKVSVSFVWENRLGGICDTFGTSLDGVTFHTQKMGPLYYLHKERRERDNRGSRQPWLP